MNRIGQFVAISAAVFAAAVTTGCTGNGKQAAREAAENFAKAYYSADYTTAAEMCSPQLKDMVLETGSMVDSLPDAAKDEFMELSRGVQMHTVEVHEWTKDSVSVDFDIIYPGEVEPVKTALTVVRASETGSWQVVYAQERM